jgi:hypothetical protein
MRALVALAVVLFSMPAAAKPGAIVIPPLAAELGAGTPLTNATAGSSTELRVGGSWASLYWRPTRMDVTFGYAGSFRTLAADGTAARTIDASDRELRLHGVYFDVAYALENHAHWRTWLGARFETLAGHYLDRSLTSIGAALRISSELYSTGIRGGSDNRNAALFAGAFAVGVYVEGIARTLPAELGPVGLGAGVSMRIPFIAAIGT